MRSQHPPGTSSAAMPARSRSATSCSSAAAPMPRWPPIRISAAAAGRHSRRHCRQRADRRRDRRADAAAVGPLLQHGDDRRRRTRPTDRHQHRVSRRRRRPQRSDRAANRVRSLLHLGAALLLSVPRRSSSITLGITWWMDEQPDGILSARHQGFRAGGAFARRARQPHQALRLHAQRRPDQRRRRAVCDDVRLRRSGIAASAS